MFLGKNSGQSLLDCSCVQFGTYCPIGCHFHTWIMMPRVSWGGGVWGSSPRKSWYSTLQMLHLQVDQMSQNSGFFKRSFKTILRTLAQTLGSDPWNRPKIAQNQAERPRNRPKCLAQTPQKDPKLPKSKSRGLEIGPNPWLRVPKSAQNCPNSSP